MCTNGTGATTSATTQNQNVQYTPYAQPLFADIYKRAQTVASTPYTPYTGELVAPMNGYQFGGLNQVMDYSQAAQPYLQTAGQQTQGALSQLNDAYNYATGGGYLFGYGRNYIDAGGNIISSAQNPLNTGQGMIQGGYNTIAGGQDYLPTASAYTAGGGQGVGNIGAGDIAQYMNPYQQQVIQATLGNMAENNAQQQLQVQGNAAMRGALGGDRLGVAQAELARQQALANNQTLAGLNAQNYQQATQTALTQQQNQQANLARMLQAGNQFGGLGATQSGIGTQMAGAGNAMTGSAGQLAGIGNLLAGTGLQYGTLAGQQGALGGQLASIAGMGGQLANQYGNIGTASQAAGQTGGQNLLGAGATPQQTQQALDTALYQQYLQQLAYPYQQTQFLSGIGLPSAGAMGGFQTQIGSANQVLTPPGMSWQQALIGGGSLLGGLFGAKSGGRILRSYAEGGSDDSLSDIDHPDERSRSVYEDLSNAMDDRIVPETKPIIIPESRPTPFPAIQSNVPSNTGSQTNTSGLSGLGSAIGKVIDFIFKDGGRVPGYDAGGIIPGVTGNFPSFIPTSDAPDGMSRFPQAVSPQSPTTQTFPSPIDWGSLPTSAGANSLLDTMAMKPSPIPGGTSSTSAPTSMTNPFGSPPPELEGFFSANPAAMQQVRQQAGPGGYASPKLMNQIAQQWQQRNGNGGIGSNLTNPLASGIPDSGIIPASSPVYPGIPFTGITPTTAPTNTNDIWGPNQGVYAVGGGVEGSPYSFGNAQGPIPPVQMFKTPRVNTGELMQMRPMMDISKAASAIPAISPNQMNQLGTVASRLMTIKGRGDEEASGGRIHGYAGGGVIFDPTNRFPYPPPIPQKFPNPFLPPATQPQQFPEALPFPTNQINAGELAALIQGITRPTNDPSAGVGVGAGDLSGIGQSNQSSRSFDQVIGGTPNDFMQGAPPGQTMFGRGTPTPDTMPESDTVTTTPSAPTTAPTQAPTQAPTPTPSAPATTTTPTPNTDFVPGGPWDPGMPQGTPVTPTPGFVPGGPWDPDMPQGTPVTQSDIPLGNPPAGNVVTMSAPTPDNPLGTPVDAALSTPSNAATPGYTMASNTTPAPSGWDFTSPATGPFDPGGGYSPTAAAVAGAAMTGPGFGSGYGGGIGPLGVPGSGLADMAAAMGSAPGAPGGPSLGSFGGQSLADQAGLADIGSASPATGAFDPGNGFTSAGFTGPGFSGTGLSDPGMGGFASGSLGDVAGQGFNGGGFGGFDPAGGSMAGQAGIGDIGGPGGFSGAVGASDFGNSGFGSPGSMGGFGSVGGFGDASGFNSDPGDMGGGFGPGGFSGNDASMAGGFGGFDSGNALGDAAGLGDIGGFGDGSSSAGDMGGATGDTTGGGDTSGDGGGDGSGSNGSGWFRGGRFRAAGGPVHDYSYFQGFEEGGDIEDDDTLPDIPSPAQVYPSSDEFSAQRAAPQLTSDALREAVSRRGDTKPDTLNDRFGEWGPGKPLAGTQMPPLQERPVRAAPVVAPPNPYAAARQAAAPAGPAGMDPARAGWSEIMNQRSPMYQNATPQRQTMREILTNPRSRSDFLTRLGVGILAADPSKGWGSTIGQGLAGTVGTFDKFATEDMTARQKAQSLAAQIKRHAETLGETSRHHGVVEDIARGRLEQDNWKHIGYTTEGAPVMMNTKTRETINGATQKPLTDQEKMSLSGRSGTGTGQTERIISELRRENPTLTYAEAFGLVKRSGQSPDVLALRREAIALSAAKADMDYLTKPMETIEKYRKKYGATLAPANAPSPNVGDEKQFSDGKGGTVTGVWNGTEWQPKK